MPDQGQGSRWKTGFERKVQLPVEKIWKTLFYGGLTKQEYQDCQETICAENRRKLHAYLDISIIFLFMATCLSGGIGILRAKSTYYAIALLVCVGLRSVDLMFLERNGLLLKWLMYAFAAVLYVLGIAVALQAPEELSVSFIAFSLAVPLLFVMPPIQHITNVLFFDVVFSVLTVIYESERIMVEDIFNALFFGAISCILSVFTMQIMYQNALGGRKLRQVASHDLLTGMKSRNAYEEERLDLNRECTLSLSCIYVDVNGLHELNNSQGHAEGDKMLQVIAWEMRQTFDDKRCYRIGGDEFVAFVIDRQDAAVRAEAEELTRVVEAMGYSIAVGVATQSAGGIAVDDLAKRAEKRMYYAKEDHYRALNQQAR